MSIIPPSGRPPGRDPGEPHRLVTVRHDSRAVYEITVSPGADLHDLATATATLPNVLYTDHRPVTPRNPAVVLTFRALPTGVDWPDGAPVRPSSPRGAAPVSGWVPTLDPNVAEVEPSAYELALRAILETDAFRVHGQSLVYGLVFCDPDAVIAAAEGIVAQWTQRI